MIMLLSFSIDEIPIAAMVCDGHGVVQTINHEAELLLGLQLKSSCRLEMRAFKDLSDCCLGENTWSPLMALQFQKKVHQMVKYQCLTGEVLYLDMDVKALKGGWALCTLTDRSRQKTLEQFHQITMADPEYALEERLWGKEEQLEALIKAIPDFMFVVSRKGVIQTFHAEAVEELYMPPDVFLGKRIQELLPEGLGERTTVLIDQACESGRIHNFEYHLPLNDTIRSFEARVKRINPEMVIILSRDITEQKEREQKQKQLEQQLLRSQKLESLGSLAGGVAHDMNNVLGAILGMVSACQFELEVGHVMAHRLEIISKACERGRTMVKGLLEFARRDLAETRSLDLNQLIQEGLALLEHTTLNRVRLNCELDSSLRPVIGDPSAISHAIMNLCINAVDAMPNGGSLTLQSHNRPNGEVQVSIMDTGIGMSEEVMEKAISPFFTTKPMGKGTGLGLSSAYGTMKAHGGRLEIHSRPGTGTEVNLFFPAKSELEIVSVEKLQGNIPGSSLSWTILLVDDDEMVQSSMQTLLTALGSKAHVASRGEEALRMLSDGLSVDLVILDINMPGLGGTGTLPRLREMRPNLPVVLATGRADQNAKNLASTFPKVTLLPKPFDLKELREHISRIEL